MDKRQTLFSREETAPWRRATPTLILTAVDEKQREVWLTATETHDDGQSQGISRQKGRLRYVVGGIEWKWRKGREDGDGLVALDTHAKNNKRSGTSDFPGGGQSTSPFNESN